VRGENPPWTEHKTSTLNGTHSQHTGIGGFANGNANQQRNDWIQSHQQKRIPTGQDSTVNNNNAFTTTHSDRTGLDRERHDWI
jgi:hypothetical protein